MKQKGIFSNIILYLVVFAVMVVGVHAEYPATFVDLGLAGNFAVLSEDTASAITSTGSTTIYGDIGCSPAAATMITGFGALPLDPGTQCFSTSPQVPGYKVYAADYNTLGCTTPAYLTTAVSNRQTAFTAATGGANTPASGASYLNLGAGTLTAQTLTPGVYTWGTGLSITGDLTLDCQGNSSAVFVFQISGNLDLATVIDIILTNGCQASRVFWAVSGTTALNTGSHFEGNLITGPATTQVTVFPSTTVNGRLLGAKTIALQASTIVTMPVDSVPSIGSTITEEVNQTSARINWTTDVLANSSINYGTTLALGTNVSDASLVFNHSLLISGLLPNTTYYYNITSCDGIGNCNTSGTYDFITTAASTVPGTGLIRRSGGGGSGGSGTTTNVTNTTIVITPVTPVPTVICTPDYQCGSWSSCVNSRQTRTCVDSNKCSTNNEFFDVTTCGIEPTKQPEVQPAAAPAAKPTAPAQPASSTPVAPPVEEKKGLSWWSWLIIAIVLLALLALAYVFWPRKKKYY